MYCDLGYHTILESLVLAINENERTVREFRAEVFGEPQIEGLMISCYHSGQLGISALSCWHS